RSLLAGVAVAAGGVVQGDTARSARGGRSGAAHLGGLVHAPLRAGADRRTSYAARHQCRAVVRLNRETGAAVDEGQLDVRRRRLRGPQAYVDPVGHAGPDRIGSFPLDLGALVDRVGDLQGLPATPSPV